MDSRRFMKIPTIYPYKQYNPTEDVQFLHSAFELNKNKRNETEDAVIRLLTKRSNPQRLDICQSYKKTLDRELEEEINKIFKSKFRKVLVALLRPPFEFLACELEKGLTAMMTDDELISEILCTRSNDKIKQILQTYQQIFGKALEFEIDNQHDLSAQYKKFFMVLICCPRNEAIHTDGEKAKEIAASINNAVETENKDLMTQILIRTLTHESYNQLCLIFDEYRQISGCSIQEAIIKANLAKDVQYSFLAIVNSAISKHQYYAERIEQALKKSLRRDDHTLIRVFVSRAEIDLEEIKREYLRNYHKTLYNAIRSELSGPYKEVMLALLNTP